MFKKILLYGVAFGSIAGAFLFIHLNNYGVNQSVFQKGFYALLQLILLPATCVYLIIKTVRRDFITQGGDALKPGNLVMAGLFTAVVMSLTVSLVYLYIHSQFNGLIEKALVFDSQMLESQKENLIEKLAEKNDPRTYEELKNTYLEQYNVGYQFRTNLFQYSSVGLLVSGIMALFYISKDKKSNK
jgi:hypothetical protein